MKSKRTVTIALTGGLGNQLFQLAAALSCAESGFVQILTEQGNPRKNQSDLPEIFSFSLPDNVKVIHGGYFKWLSSKIIGFNLRLGLRPKRIEAIFLPLIHFVSKLTLLVLTGKLWKLAVSDDVGLPSKLNLGRNTLLIGYFQTAKFIEKIGTNNFISNSLTQDSYLSKYRNLSELEDPLVIHVRLGDYRSEDKIGILSSKYFQETSTLLIKSGKYKKIWLFSDEPQEAIKIFDKQFTTSIRLIHSHTLSSAEILQIMSFGKGYLISNSTFGWWGAYLSKTLNAEVTVPIPWFKSLPEPRDLVPKHWNRVKGFEWLE